MKVHNFVLLLTVACVPVGGVLHAELSASAVSPMRSRHATESHAYSALHQRVR
jgi:hypothetical protein